MSSGFVDQAQLHAKAGDGGAGAVSFRREAHVSRGGPDGGDGGRGGDVWLAATTGQASLLSFKDRPHRRAEDGRHGGGKRRRGAKGRDLEVAVPVGTVVRELDGTVVADLASNGQRFLAASGGRGGRGNASFLTNRRRAPAFAEQGERGEERWLNLELKLMADIAIVGLPNAGKSTLIASISAARPKVAPYPFTTLEPHLGVVRIGARPGRPGDELDLVIADVPGLIEGAAEGRGLGHRFLRHVERARALLVLVDLGPGEVPPPAHQLEVLLGELARYRRELAHLPRLVVGSKLDVAPASARDRGVTDVDVSAVTRQGLPEMLERLGHLVEVARAAEGPGARREVVVHRPLGGEVEVRRVAPGRIRVTGRPAERAVSFHDLNDEGALEEARRRLQRLGVDRLLRRAGVRQGDVIEVGAVSFEWQEFDQGALEAPEQGSRR